MPEVYVANCTIQNFQFEYSTAPKVQRRTVKIKPYAQEKLPDNMTNAEVAYVENLHRRYGMKRVEEVKDLSTFTGLIMSVGAPVPLAALHDTIDNNRDKLRERGQELRKESAIASSETLAGKHPDVPIDSSAKLEAMEIEIIEEETPGRDTEVNETIRVDNTEQGEKRGPARQRGGRRG